MEPEGFEFGDIRVDLRLQTVTRAGEPVALEPKTFDVLRHLLVHRDRLVTKDELLDSVWKDTFVTPNVLTRAVAQLRKALGDDAQEPRYLETVARRGYRFVATVTEPGPSVPFTRKEPGPSVPVWTIALGAMLIGTLGWLGFSRAGVDDPAPALSLARITASGDVIDAAISPDGRYVVYVRSAGGLQSLWVRQVAAANPVQLIPPASVGYWGVAFSPDSEQPGDCGSRWRTRAGACVTYGAEAFRAAVLHRASVVTRRSADCRRGSG
ncbi:MAG: winged helix-turn-helix domain-containing protein [Vicinamibacterales bacterium]